MDDGGAGSPKLELSADWHSAVRAVTSVFSGTRLISDREVISACHWPSWLAASAAMGRASWIWM